jgi:hypothetical protein
MAWRLFVLPADKRTAMEEVLMDDVLWRQTRIYREASTLGGKTGELYLYLDGSDTAMERADKLIPPLAAKVDPKDAERIHTQLKEEQDKAASGMGLMFAD